MSVFIDRNFLLQVSPKLQRFTKKKDDLYNFRCPLCGDSQKNKLKSRGYVYRKKNDYFYMCHNGVVCFFSSPGRIYFTLRHYFLDGCNTVQLLLLIKNCCSICKYEFITR